MVIEKYEITRLTEEYGGQWGINHTRRLLQLISIVAEGQTYNEEAVWLAAHLHDWGAYAPWAQKDIDHVVRSCQVAEDFLTEGGYSPPLKALVLECIALHHSSEGNRSLESILLRDVDALDFLGVVGVLRDFSKNPRDLRKAFAITKQRREQLPALLVLDRAKIIAAERVNQMDELLASFEEQSFGCF
jgi:HD superfamily phosphodiesterase